MKTNHVTYDRSTHVHHFLNGITDPSMDQTKLSLEANHNQYSGKFDATVKYLKSQVTHQQVNQQLNIASLDSGTFGRLKTSDTHGNDFKMPLSAICLKTGLSSLPPRSAVSTNTWLKQLVVAGVARVASASISGPIASWVAMPSVDYKALAASMATLSQHVNVMVIQLGAKPCEAADAKMGANAKNPVLFKNPKKEKEWLQTLSVGYITYNICKCPIVTVRSLDSSLNSKIQVELDSHAGTSAVGSNVLVVHDHKCYIEVYGYDNKSRHIFLLPPKNYIMPCSFLQACFLQNA